MSYSNLEYHKVSLSEEGVLHVEINRPERLNAMNEPCWTEYGKILAQAGRDSDVRAVVVNGVGRAFCAGLDVVDSAQGFAERQAMDTARAGLHLGQHIRDFQASLHQAHLINKPVIGVAHGPCIGLAIDLLSAFDVRFAAKDSVFSVREIMIGMAADIGTLQRLPKIVGSLGWVKDVALTGRNFKVDEALAQGFVQRAYETREEAVQAALDYAKEICQLSPVAVWGTKRSINYAIDHTVADSLEQIAEYNSFALLGEDFAKGAMSFRSKDKPKYSKL